jgi:glyoxylase-like metal-dependent hydrolase (beta-lactamase superfamily II)
MRIGSVSIDLLCDGYYRVDAGSLFGIVPKEVWSHTPGIRVDKRNRIRLALNTLLIRTRDATILVDTGIGGKADDKRKQDFRFRAGRLQRRLRELGVTPRSVSHVILTHLHFTSAGGATRHTPRGTLVPTFPAARYLVQKSAFQDAQNPSERSAPLYRREDFVPLEEAGRLEMLEGDCEVTPGVRLMVTNGHCPGHQIVLVQVGGMKVAYLGDLVPTPFHLEPQWVSAYDSFPDDTARCKRDILNMAEKQGWTLLFPAWEQCPAALLRRRNGKLVREPIRL